MSRGRPVGSTGAEGGTAGLLMSGIHVITQRVALSGGAAQADITALIAAFFRHAVCGQIHLVPDRVSGTESVRFIRVSSLLLLPAGLLLSLL